MIDLDSRRRVALARAIEAAGAMEFGDFTLRGGERAGYYLDLRRLTLSRGLKAVAYALAWVTEGFPDIDVVGGPTAGADPIVGALLFGWGDRLSRGFLVRPEAKDHGKSGLVMGSVGAGDRCLVVEDVVTTGGSLLHAIAAVEALGARVTHAACVLDRKGELGPKLRERGIDYASLLTWDDLGLGGR